MSDTGPAREMVLSVPGLLMPVSTKPCQNNHGFVSTEDRDEVKLIIIESWNG